MHRPGWVEQVLLSSAIKLAAPPSRPDEVEYSHTREKRDRESALRLPWRAIQKEENKNRALPLWVI